jgi:hypothetical protein
MADASEPNACLSDFRFWLTPDLIGGASYFRFTPDSRHSTWRLPLLGVKRTWLAGWD